MFPLVNPDNDCCHECGGGGGGVLVDGEGPASSVYNGQGYGGGGCAYGGATHQGVILLEISSV